VEATQHAYPLLELLDLKIAPVKIQRLGQQVFVETPIGFIIVAVVVNVY
jgi:hypothetical protein